jgi:hypothetical protein
MRKTLVAALIITAGLGGQAMAQVAPPEALSLSNLLVEPSTKVGLLSVSLNNQAMAYDKGGGKWGVQINPSRGIAPNPARTWDIWSYEYLANCLGTVTYRSATKQINNKSIINAINQAFRKPASGNTAGGIFVTGGSPYIGQFGTNTAQLVVINYDNYLKAPPYPPSEDLAYPDLTVPTSFNALGIPNAPWNFFDVPSTGTADGATIALTWPNQNYISWGKPNPDSEGPQWLGVRVFVIDPKNANENLRCFDVTPFFAIEEAFCSYCWDTADRVTDGSITAGTSVTDPPCAIGGQLCGRKGSGTTKFYWTLKFNSIGAGWEAPNALLEWYYWNWLGFDKAWGETYGTILDEGNINKSTDSLRFTVNGIATYKWSYKKMSDGFTWPVGTTSMSSSGFGYSPLCGVFSGTVSMTDYDRTSSKFGGAICIP